MLVDAVVGVAKHRYQQVLGPGRVKTCHDIQPRVPCVVRTRISAGAKPNHVAVQPVGHVFQHRVHDVPPAKQIRRSRSDRLHPRSLGLGGSGPAIRRRQGGVQRRRHTTSEQLRLQQCAERFLGRTGPLMKLFHRLRSQINRARCIIGVSLLPVRPAQQSMR